MHFFLSSVHLLQDVEFRPAGHQVSPSFIAPLIALHTFIHIIHNHKMLPFRFMSTNTQTMHRIKLARPSFAATWRVGTKGWAACNGRNFFPFQTKKQWTVGAIPEMISTWFAMEGTLAELSLKNHKEPRERKWTKASCSLFVSTVHWYKEFLVPTCVGICIQERNSCRKLRAHCLNSKNDEEWICRKWSPIICPAFSFHKLK